MRFHLWRLFGENEMTRNLIHMTKTIFDELKTGVEKEHVSYITDVKRRIEIDKAIQDKCCNFLKNAKIIGIKKYSVIVAFIKFEENVYIGIDSRYAEEFEKNYGYTVEEKSEIVIGSQILCIAEKLYEFKVDSIKLIENCFALEPEKKDTDAVVFSPQDIFELVYGISIFSIGDNELELLMDSQDDLRRVLLLLIVDANIQLSIGCKEMLLKLATMTVTRKICNNLLDFVTISDNRIKFLTLYQCIEYLFIPNRASEFKEKYNMNIIDALRLHINESSKSTERDNVMAILKKYASMPIISKFRSQLELSESVNQIEKVNNWIYDLRCSIAHFRYGQVKEDNLNNWNDIFGLMLELLVSIYNNIDKDVQDICNGIVAV